MIDMEEYQTALEKAKDTKKTLILSIVGSAESLDDKHRRVKEAAIVAIQEEDFNIFGICFTFLPWFTYDLYLFPLTFPGEEKGTSYLPLIRRKEAIARAREKAEEIWVQNIFDLCGCAKDHPAAGDMLDINTLLFQVLAEKWRSVQDEAIADRCFENMIELFPNLYQNQSKRLIDALRTNTPCDFPINRLVRSYLHLIEQAKKRDLCRDEMAQIISNAIIRNKRRTGRFEMEQQVVQHLHDCGDAAFSYVEEMAKEIKKVDMAVKALIRDIQADISMISSTEITRLVYQNWQKAHAEIKMTVSGTNTVNQVFYRARDIIPGFLESMKQNHWQYSIDLSLINKDKSTHPPVTEKFRL